MSKPERLGEKNGTPDTNLQQPRHQIVIKYQQGEYSIW